MWFNTLLHFEYRIHFSVFKVFTIKKPRKLRMRKYYFTVDNYNNQRFVTS